MKCNFCESEIKIFNWGASPIAGYKVNSISESISQPKFPLEMLFCPKCNYTKYNEYPSMSEILVKMYEQQEATYSQSNKISDYLEDLVSELISKYSLSKNSSILEIGCNDGSLLFSFKTKLQCTLIGIEPSKHFKDIWESRKLNVINDFFPSNALKEIRPKFNLIIIRHVLEHISDVKNIIEQISKLMDESSVLLIEVPYLQTVLKNKRIENISHPHLNYFSIRSINEIISKYGLGISEYKLVKTDGGSILLHIKKNIKTEKTKLDSLTADDFIKLMEYKDIRKIAIDTVLQKYKKGEVVGSGAGAKGQHLIHLFDLERYIDTVFDINKNFVGKYIPGTSIQIKLEDFQDNNIKAVINLAPTLSWKIKSKIPDHLSIIDIIEEE